MNEDSRQSFNDIADLVGKTEATIRRRVKKLEKKNIIKKYTIEYEMNSKPKVYATIKIQPDFKKVKRILRELKQVKEISDVWRLSGDCGVFLRIEIPSIEEFNPLLEGKLMQINGIKIIDTCFITDIIK